MNEYIGYGGCEAVRWNAPADKLMINTHYSGGTKHDVC